LELNPDIRLDFTKAAIHHRTQAFVLDNRDADILPFSNPVIIQPATRTSVSLLPDSHH
jgi:hypothetical protein